MEDLWPDIRGMIEGVKRCKGIAAFRLRMLHHHSLPQGCACSQDFIFFIVTWSHHDGDAAFQRVSRQSQTLGGEMLRKACKRRATTLEGRGRRYGRNRRRNRLTHRMQRKRLACRSDRSTSACLALQSRGCIRWRVTWRSCPGGSRRCRPTSRGLGRSRTTRCSTSSGSWLTDKAPLRASRARRLIIWAMSRILAKAMPRVQASTCRGLS